MRFKTSASRALPVALCLLGFALGGCASSAPVASDGAEYPSEPELSERVERADHRLREALDAATQADCPRACEHLSALCAYADALCDAARDEPDPTTMGYCEDARARCRTGSVEVEARCGVCPEDASFE